MTDTNLQSKIEALNQPPFDLKKNDVLVSGQKKIVQFITDTVTATFDNETRSTCVIAVDGYVGTNYTSLINELKISFDHRKWISFFFDVSPDKAGVLVVSVQDIVEDKFKDNLSKLFIAAAKYMKTEHNRDLSKEALLLPNKLDADTLINTVRTRDHLFNKLKDLLTFHKTLGIDEEHLRQIAEDGKIESTEILTSLIEELNKENPQRKGQPIYVLITESEQDQPQLKGDTLIIPWKYALKLDAVSLDELKSAVPQGSYFVVASKTTSIKLDEASRLFYDTEHILPEIKKINAINSVLEQLETIDASKSLAEILDDVRNVEERYILLRAIEEVGAKGVDNKDKLVEYLKFLLNDKDPDLEAVSARELIDNQISEKLKEHRKAQEKLRDLIDKKNKLQQEKQAKLATTEEEEKIDKAEDIKAIDNELDKLNEYIAKAKIENEKEEFQRQKEYNEFRRKDKGWIIRVWEGFIDFIWPQGKVYREAIEKIEDDLLIIQGSRKLLQIQKEHRLEFELGAPYIKDYILETNTGLFVVEGIE